MKLTGYSSDDLGLDGKFVKTKKQRLREKQAKLFSKTPPLELDEWFVYLVDNEKWYFKVSQDENALRLNHQVEFLGIGRPNKAIHKPSIKEQVKELREQLKPNVLISQKVSSNKCCYCEVKLTKPDNSSATSKTKEHIIPKHKGGNIIRHACYECNQEKGGLMLHSYIQFLNYRLMEVSPDQLIKLQTKIKNANKIAKEIGAVN